MNAAAGRTETTAGEAITVMAICFGWAILLSLHAVAAGFPAPGGFSDAGGLVMVVIELACAAIALAVLRHRRYAISSLMPRPSWGDSAIGAWLWPMVFVHVLFDIVALVS